MSAAPSPATGLAGEGTVVELAVSGMHCPSCVALIEEVLSERDGVRSVSVDLDTGRAAVRFDPAVVGVDDLQAVVTATGYPATPTG